jgi:hypothetical protein
VSKGVVYRAYVNMCGREGRPVMFTRPVMGKMVKRAFPQVRTKRRGPRGHVAQYYVGLRHRRDGTAQAVQAVKPAPNRQASARSGVGVIKRHPLQVAAGQHKNESEHDESASEMRPGLSGSSEDLMALALPFFELLAPTAEEPPSKTATTTTCSWADCAAEERTSGDQGCVKTEGEDLLEALERQWEWESGAMHARSSTTDDRLECFTSVADAHTSESLVEEGPLLAELPPPGGRRNSLLEWAGQVIPPLPSWPISISPLHL